MSDNNYWKKLKNSILESLGQEMASDAKNGRYLEAVMLQFCLMETELRYSLVWKIDKFPDEDRMAKYYSSEMTNFASLIDYLELLRGNPPLISSLRKYNADRVKIVHKIMFFESVAQLQKTAKETY
ncbi:MAG TPA: hypothetical protein VMV71_00175, partial [Candidatus Paceibacterota bacterium]|nr:hypothetical protein [Candidatus Paceibacterota bacterium]